MSHTQVEFQAWFETFFATHDADQSGTLDKAEAESFARGIHALRQDGTEFSLERAEALWTSLSVDGQIPKAAAYAKLYERAVAAGKISNP